MRLVGFVFRWGAASAHACVWLLAIALVLGHGMSWVRLESRSPWLEPVVRSTGWLDRLAPADEGHVVRRVLVGMEQVLFPRSGDGVIEAEPLGVGVRDWESDRR